MEWLEQKCFRRSPGHPAENWALLGHVLLPSGLCIFPIELQLSDLGSIPKPSIFQLRYTMLRPSRTPWSPCRAHEEQLTRVFLFTMGEGCGVPDTGVEPGVLISSIIILTFSGTLVASLQISSHPGSLDFRKSAHCIQIKRYLSKIGFFLKLHKSTG